MYSRKFMILQIRHVFLPSLYKVVNDVCHAVGYYASNISRFFLTLLVSMNEIVNDLDCKVVSVGSETLVFSNFMCCFWSSCICDL